MAYDIREVTMAYEVIVGNIGSVYNGRNRSEATEVFSYYCGLSRQKRGRAAGETVTLIKNHEVTAEMIGTNHEEEN